MPRLLPSLKNAAEYARVHPTNVWDPALDEIIRLHSLPAAPRTRFADGANPVFGLGREWVIKLVPPLRASVALREIEALDLLALHPQVPVARLLAHGLIDDWHYLVTARLNGEPLHRVWTSLNREERFQLAADYGHLLASLHQVPTGGLRPGGVIWSDFCHASITQWSARQDFDRLPARLQADGPRYLSRHRAALGSEPAVLLHGDLAPENVLVRRRAGSWEISGMIDFGNATYGPPLFDLTAPTVLLQPGDRTIVQILIEHGTADHGVSFDAQRNGLMAGTMIHPMADLVDCLGLVPGAQNCSTWDEVALKFWPA